MKTLMPNQRNICKHNRKSKRGKFHFKLFFPALKIYGDITTSDQPKTLFQNECPVNIFFNKLDVLLNCRDQEKKLQNNDSTYFFLSLSSL